MRIHKLALSIGIVLFVYALLKILFSYVFVVHGEHVPIPASVIKMYMFFVVMGVFIWVTSDEKSAKEVFDPFVNLVFDPKKRAQRTIAFAITPIFAIGLSYYLTKPTLDAPIELRTVHPAPPSSINVYNKTFNMLTLENPFRPLEHKDPEKFKGLIDEGRDIFYANCHYCHGDILNGKGYFSRAFNNPMPANFQDVGTIAQLKESFLFWRITTGGPGLPNEGAPWMSPMPVWQNYLKEEEVWKVILFLYDYTGHSPRTFSEEGEDE